MKSIGIDLGTTNSLISVWTDEGPVIIPNSLGENLTPSVVAIDENNELLVGRVAKEWEVTHPEDTVSVFKRDMGTKKKYKLGSREFLPEELSSIVIRTLKEDAEKFLKEKVIEAVISVPAYFNDTQRKATKRAGELAGLKVERLVTEPTAAALAYGLHEQREETKFLVFDLGGGTFDISILELFDDIMEVRAAAGDNYLGGEDFTKILINLFLKENSIKQEDLTPKEYSIIRKEAEFSKRNFKNNNDVEMKIELKGEEIKTKISFERYERECKSLLNRLREPIERALGDAKLKLKDIDSILLVGGATKLSIIRSFVSKLFGKLAYITINPDEVVALGAAVQAALKNHSTGVLKEMILTDVSPYTLGTSISVKKDKGYYESGYFMPIIERNTVVPVSRVERLYTIHDNQKVINIDIVQGESRLSKDNIFLGEINIPVPPKKGGEEGIDVRFTYDINGILEVEVTVLSTNLKRKVVIEKNQGNMSQEEINERLIELENLKIHPRDNQVNKLIIARGERLYQENIGDIRRQIGDILIKFEDILQKQDLNDIKRVREEIKEYFDLIDGRGDF